LVVAKVLFGLVLLAVAVRVADMRLEQGCAVVTLTFYVLAYGWGYNYLTWVSPLVLLAESVLISAAYLAIATATTLAVLYGNGGVHSAFLGCFDLQSPVWRYSWATSVALWMFCAAVFGTRIIPKWLARGGPIPP
jgi:hypothetical protein